MISLYIKWNENTKERETASKYTAGNQAKECRCLSKCFVRLWWCHWKLSLLVVMSRLGVWRGSTGAIKRPGGPCFVADCFPPAKSDPVFACVRLCVSACSRADDRGHGLPTRGTANEKEAFPLTFHGSQKQFAQRKVAKQPQSYSVKLVQGGGRENASTFVGRNVLYPTTRLCANTALAPQQCIINKFALYVLKLFCIGKNKFIFHASVALWLLLIENTEWFPTSLPCTHTMSAAKKNPNHNYVTNPS